MWSKSVNKTILIAGLLVLVLGVGILIKTEVGRGYFGWLKASLLEPKSESLVSKSDDINFTNVGLNGLGKGESKEELEAGAVLKEKDKTISVVSKTPKAVTKEEIEAQINDIQKKADEMKGEIERLAVLNEIKQQMNDIQKKADEMKGEIERLAVLNQLNQMSQEVQKIGQKINEFNQINVLTGVQYEQSDTTVEETSPLSKGILSLA